MPKNYLSTNLQKRLDQMLWIKFLLEKEECYLFYKIKNIVFQNN